MEKLIAVMFLASFLTLAVPAQETIEKTVEFNEHETYICGVGESIILELPANEKYSITPQSNSNWLVDGELNLVWVYPRAAGDVLALVISDDQNRQAKVTIRSVKSGEGGIKKIVIKELTPGPVPAIPKLVKEEKGKEKAIKEEHAAGVAMQAQAADSQPPAVVWSEPGKASGDEVEAASKTDKPRDIDWETLFGMTGGIFSINKKGNFALNGEVVLAGKNKKGLFGQFAAVVDVNSFQKRYGQSVGAGFENDKVGIFLFADLLETKLEEFLTTIHYQIRPALRFRSRRIVFQGFYAIALSPDQYTGSDDLADSSLGIYNRAVSHFGFNLDALILDNLLLKADGLIGNSSIYRIGVGLEFNLAKNIQFVANLHKASYGGHPLLLNAGYGDSFEVTAGFNVGMGNILKFKDRRSKIIFPGDYPLIVNLKKQKPGDSGLKIELSAAPVTGYAPLSVSFTALIAGGQSPYKLTWDYNFGKSDSVDSCMSEWSYPLPGVYYAKVVVEDKNGKKAESNVVTIRVLENNGLKMYTITVSAGAGGTVAPGTTQVSDGQDSPNFQITPNAGYDIDYVLIDSQNQGKLTNYHFNAVHADHKLEAYFRSNNAPANKFNIDASAGTGLTINPSGTKQYNAGDNASYTVTVADPAYGIDQVFVDGTVMATSPSAPYTYPFTNIQANHTINATSKKVKFNIAASTDGNGTITPSGSVSVNINANQSFTITPKTGYDINQVIVDGSPVASPPNPYTFYNVTADHTINVTFKLKQFTITVWASTGQGHTDPGVGTYKVNYGSNFQIHNIADPGKAIITIHVDGNTYSPQEYFTISNITADHGYWVDFTPAPPVYHTIHFITYINDAYTGDLIDTITGSQQVLDGQPFNFTFAYTYPAYPTSQLHNVLVDTQNYLANGGPITVNIASVTSDHMILAYYNKY